MKETMASPPSPSARALRPLPNFIFMSRWLQVPLYLGLILAQCVYVYHFWVELVHLIQAAMGSGTALSALTSGIGYKQSDKLTETVIMLAVLGLIDVVMIANLLIMVIIGGYETFVSRIRLNNHPDQPEWLSHVNANVLKVKLAMAIIGISSIHLLKTFIEVGDLGYRGAVESVTGSNYTSEGVMWQVLIHLTFVLSAVALAVIDRMSLKGKLPHSDGSEMHPEHSPVPVAS